MRMQTLLRSSMGQARERRQRDSSTRMSTLLSVKLIVSNSKSVANFATLDRPRRTLRCSMRSTKLLLKSRECPRMTWRRATSSRISTSSRASTHLLNKSEMNSCHCPTLTWKAWANGTVKPSPRPRLPRLKFRTQLRETRLRMRSRDSLMKQTPITINSFVKLNSLLSAKRWKSSRKRKGCQLYLRLIDIKSVCGRWWTKLTTNMMELRQAISGSPANSLRDTWQHRGKVRRLCQKPNSEIYALESVITKF